MINNRGGRGHKLPYETKAVRIPVDLIGIVKSLAVDYEKNNCIATIGQENLKPKLKEILAKVDQKEKGYKSNSAGQLIADLKTLLG